jgi:GT2 family glycosyltransferase
MLGTARTGVVVLNYGHPRDTWACLESLEQSGDGDLDVVVVDNAPEGADHDRLREGVGGRAEVVASGSNLGYAGGNNLGIARLLDRDVDQVMLLNPDARVEPHTLRVLRRLLHNRPRCGVVGPRLVFPGTPSRICFDGGVVNRENGATWHRRRGHLEAGAPVRRARRTDFVTGAAVMVRADTVREVGLLPERYFMYYEETDWCLRAARAGWKLLVQPRARVTHLKRSGIEVPQPYAVYYLTRNRYFFARDVLGIDPEQALAHQDDTLVRNWRARVLEHAPHWRATFEELVSAGKADARAGRDGRRPDVEAVADAEGHRLVTREHALGADRR